MIRISSILFFTLLISASCVFKSNTINVDIKKTSLTSKLVSSVSIVNNQVIVNGNGLAGVTALKIGAENFTIESATSNKIVANANHAVSMTVGAILDLVLQSAEGAASFPITFTLADGSVTVTKLSSMGAAAGQILQYSGSAWVPTSLTSPQVYLGTWNATTNLPDLTIVSSVAGDYYIVATAGTFNSVAYAIGDWIISDGANWQKVANSGVVVSSFNGRQGIVVPMSGDYTWAQINKASSKLEDIADINITGRADQKVLKWDTASSKWIMGDDITGAGAPPAGSITTTEILDGTIANVDVSATANIAQSKIANLTTDLAGKIGLTSISATAPLVYNNATGAFTISASTTSAAGTMSAADKTKVDGLESISSGDGLIERFSGVLSSRTCAVGELLKWRTITGWTCEADSISDSTKLPLTGGTVTGDVTFNTKILLKDGTVANSITLKAPDSGTSSYVLTLPPTAGSASQVLTTNGSGVTSWTTPGLPAGTLSGSGTVNYIPYYSAASTLANSPMTVSGSNVGIGITTPLYSLDVNGSIHTTGAASFENASATAGGPTFSFWKHRNYAATQTGDDLGFLSFFGHDGALRRGGYIVARQESVSAGSIPTYLSFATAAAGNADALERMRISAAGNVGIGTTTPTAVLHLKAGTAAANTAPIKLTSGINLTAPEPGSIEYDGTNLYFTDSTSARRTLGVAGSGVTTAFGRSGAVVATAGDYTATLVTNTPAGNIAAATVQAAINELDGEKQAVDATLTSLAAFNTNGILVQTAADTFTGRTLTGTALRTTINNGDGVVGNPTIDIDTTLFPSPTVGDVGKFLKSGGAAASTWVNIAGTDVSNTAAGNIVATNIQVAINELDAEKQPLVTNSAGLAAALSNETGTGLSVFNSAPTILNPIIANIAPGADFTLTQNAVVPFTSVNTGAVDNTLYLKTGRVGIGNSSPGYALDVQSSDSFQARIFHSSENQYDGSALMMTRTRGTLGTNTAVTSGDTIGGFYFRAHDGAGTGTTNSAIEVSAGENHSATNRGTFLIFETTTNGSASRSEKMRIHSNGNVGIGTSTPSYPLSIYRSASSITSNIESGGNGTAALNRYAGLTNGAATRVWGAGLNQSLGNGEYEVYDYTAAASRLLINTSGNVGIGTTLPSTLLDVRGAIRVGPNTDTFMQELEFWRNGVRIGAVDNSGGHVRLKSTNNNDLFLIDSLNNGIVVKNGGNVGIGTTTPTSPLTVSTTTVSGNIANFVSTGVGGAGCSIAWNGASCSSDIRLKENINPITQALDDVLKLQGVTFTWKKDKQKTPQIGFIAQQLEKFFPQVVKEDSAGYKQVNYANLVSVVVEAIKDFYHRWSSDSKVIHRQLASVKSEVQNLKAENTQIKAQNLEVKKALCEMGKKAFCKKD